MTAEVWEDSSVASAGVDRGCADRSSCFCGCYCYVQCSGWLLLCACTSLGALWCGGEMQWCCAEEAPQIKHGVISKVPTVETHWNTSMARACHWKTIGEKKDVTCWWYHSWTEITTVLLCLCKDPALRVHCSLFVCSSLGLSSIRATSPIFLLTLFMSQSSLWWVPLGFHLTRAIPRDKFLLLINLNPFI